MMKIKTGAVLLVLALALAETGCQRDECEDCGPGIEEGYLYKRVTQEDLAELAGIEGISLDVCITFQVLDIDTGEMDTETVMVVEDCCCDI